MSDTAAPLSGVIRELRKDCSMTQAQLAAALRIVPTSVHRWEAGTSNPDFELVVSLWSLAIEHGSPTSAKFAEFLADRAHAIKPLVSAVQGPIVQQVDSALAKLPPGDLDLVLAFIEMLKHNEDPTADQIFRVLLEPWKRKILSSRAAAIPGKHPKKSKTRPDKRNDVQ
jgi:DNA-binding XRE family transcriptional regulator